MADSFSRSLSKRTTSKLTSLFSDEQDDLSADTLKYTRKPTPAPTTPNTASSNPTLFYASTILLYVTPQRTPLGTHGMALLRSTPQSFLLIYDHTKKQIVNAAISSLSLTPQQAPYLAIYDSNNNYFSACFKTEDEMYTFLKHVAIAKHALLTDQNSPSFVDLQLSEKQSNLQPEFKGIVKAHFLPFLINIATEKSPLTPIQSSWTEINLNFNEVSDAFAKQFSSMSPSSRRFIILPPKFPTPPFLSNFSSLSGNLGLDIIISQISSASTSDPHEIKITHTEQENKEIPPTTLRNSSSFENQEKQELIDRMAKLSGNAQIIPLVVEGAVPLTNSRKKSEESLENSEAEKKEVKQIVISQDNQANSSGTKLDESITIPHVEKKHEMQMSIPQDYKPSTTELLVTTQPSAPHPWINSKEIESKLQSLENTTLQSLQSLHYKLDSLSVSIQGKVNALEYERAPISVSSVGIQSTGLEISPMQVALAFEKLIREQQENHRALEKSAQTIVALQAKINEARNQHHEQLDEQAKLIEQQYSSLRDTVQNQYKQILQLQNVRRDFLCLQLSF